VNTIKRQTWVACGCLAARSKVPCARGLACAAYRLHAHSVCYVQCRCSSVYVMCYAFSYIFLDVENCRLGVGPLLVAVDPAAVVTGQSFL